MYHCFALIMGIAQSKLQCVYLPAQSGKTRKVEDLIVRYKELAVHLDDEPCLNIFISSNNLMLTKQTETRMRKDLGTHLEDDVAVIEGNIMSWTSGDKKCNISTDALAWKIVTNEIEMVVLCSNGIRMKYLDDLIHKLSVSQLFKKRINIWIDEADKNVKLWSKYEKITELPLINRVTLVSATFDSVFAKYGEMFILGYSETFAPCYRSLPDCEKIEINEVGDNETYVRHVIDSNREYFTTPGLRAFIPGDIKTVSHDAIANFLHVELGYAVAIINGTRKVILVPGENLIDLTPFLSSTVTEEFNQQLAILYKTHQLNRFPFAITGRFCIERGITFQCKSTAEHPGFLFDVGILSTIFDKSTAYQTMARMFGNVGDFPEYKPVRIYSSKFMFTTIEQEEILAKTVAKQVTGGGGLVGKALSEKELEKEKEEKKWNLQIVEFNTFKDAREFMKAKKARCVTQKELDKKKDGNFYTSSTTKKRAILPYAETMKEIKSQSKLSMLDPGEGNAYGRVTVCYKNKEDPTSAVFICKVVTRN
jgi:hypothetical protein